MGLRAASIEARLSLLGDGAVGKVAGMAGRKCCCTLGAAKESMRKDGADA